MAAQIATTEEIAANVPALTAEGERFALRQRQARMFASSPLVPQHLRSGSPEQAIANCWIALTLAEAMGEVPLVVMQNIHVVNGKAGFASQYMIARANSSGIFKGRIDWRIEGAGESLSVTAYAVLKDTGQEVSVTCDMAMAKAEGWTKNPKYSSMPAVMLRYRSAAFLVRFYAPDVMLGYQTTEEVEDVALAAGPSAPPLTARMIETQAHPAEEAAHDTVTGELIEEPDSAGTLAGEAGPDAEDERESGPATDDEQDEREQPDEVNDRGATLLDAVDQQPAPAAGEDPAAAKANEIIDGIKAATSIAEVTATWGRNAGHIQAMDDGLRSTVVAVKEARLAELQAKPTAEAAQ
jgi:hypothetical protein